MADTMLSPMPRKAFTTSIPCTPNKVEDPSIARPFWYDADEATCELRGVLSTNGILPEWVPAFHSPAMSVASTSAGPTPSLGDISPTYAISPPLSPEYVDIAQESPRCSQSEQRCPVVLDNKSLMQERKLFVGGIPQHIDQAALHKMFSRIAKVKKAWLQLVHSDSRTRQPPIDKKHRGFGFVIFCDTIAVEQLLGDSFSRILCFDENVKVEVKRAVCKNSPQLSTPPGQPNGESGHIISDLPGAASPLSQTQWQPSHSNFDDMPQVPPFPSETKISSGCQRRPNHENVSTPTMQPLSQTQWQPSQLNFDDMPHVPPFPSETRTSSDCQRRPNHENVSTPMMQPLSQTQWQPSHLVFGEMPHVPPFPSETKISLGCQQRQNQENVSTPMMQPTPSQHFTADNVQTNLPSLAETNLPFLADVLLHGFLGVRPSSAEELKLVLEQAMPECYYD